MEKMRNLTFTMVLRTRLGLRRADYPIGARQSPRRRRIDVGTQICWEPVRIVCTGRACDRC